jgi:dTDP-4-amino-4,6-dideoxygalactose transaminase
MSDIHAALGLSQMRRLGEFVSKRRRIAERYDELFAQLPVDTPWQDRKSYSSYHLYIIRLKLPQIKKTHLQVYQSLIDAGIQVNLHYIPVYRHPVYERMGFVRGYCDQAEQYYSSALSIPIYPELTDDQQTYVVEMIRQALS